MKTITIDSLVNELRIARSNLTCLLDTTWEIGGVYSGEEEFNNMSNVKDAKEQIESINEIEKQFHENKVEFFVIANDEEKPIAIVQKRNDREEFKNVVITAIAGELAEPAEDIEIQNFDMKFKLDNEVLKFTVDGIEYEWLIYPTVLY